MSIKDSELGEALLTAGQLSPLLSKVIDPVINDIVRRYAPLVSIIPDRHHPHDQFYWNTRTALAPGAAVADGGTVPLGNGAYAQSTVQMRHMLALGAVTGYTEIVTGDTIGSLRRTEMEGTAKGLAWDLESMIHWGNDAATNLGSRPQFNGLDSLVSQFATSGNNLQNSLDWAGGAFTQGALDQLIDLVEGNTASPVSGEDYFFLMSPTAQSREAQLQMALQRNVNVTQVRAGLSVPSYRDIPIIKSGFIGSKALAMGTVTPTGATTGGTLAAGTYYYTVVPRMYRYGVLSPAPTVNVTTTGSTSVVNLAFSAPTGPQGVTTPMSYEVYRGAGAGSMTLIGVVDAVVGLQGDGITPIFANGIQDTGSALVPTFNVTTTPTSTPATYVGAQARAPRVAGGEDIFLVPRSEEMILRPWVRQWKPLDLFPTTASPDALPYGFIADTTLAVRSPQDIGRIRNIVSTLSN